jgi:hypothetical protein
MPAAASTTQQPRAPDRIESRTTPPQPVRRAERPTSVSAEQRSQLMARPFVRRALEVSGGSIIEVVRRGEAPAAAGESAAEVESPPAEAGE